MGVSTAEVIQSLLEEYVSPEVPQLYELSRPFIKRLAKGKPKETNTRGARLATKIRRNPQMTWYDSNGGTYPSAGTATYIDMRVFFASCVIAGGFTKQTLDLNKGKVLVNFVKQRVADDLETLGKEGEQQCWENGDGTKAIVTSVSGVNVTCTSPFGATRLLEGGQYAFYAPDGTQRTGGSVTVSTLSSIDGTNLIATFDQVPNNIQANDIITWVGAYRKAIHGVPYHVNNDTGQYQGQSRGTYRNLRATVYDNESAAISVSSIDRARALNKYKVGSDTKNNDFVLWAPPAQEQAYLELGYGLLRFMGGQFDGSFKDGAKHAGMNWEVANDIADNEIYGLRMKSLEWYELEAMAILKDDGLTMRQVPAFTSAGVGSYKAEVVYYLGMSGDIGSPDPRQNFKIKNIAIPTNANRLAA